MSAEDEAIVGLISGLYLKGVSSYRNLGKFAPRFGAVLPFFKEGQVLWHEGPITITGGACGRPSGYHSLARTQ